MAVAIGVIGLAMSAYSIYQSVQAAEEAEEIGKANQKRIEAEADEEARRERYNLSRQQSLIKARVAASGIKGTTPEAYFTEFSRQRENEIRWIQTSAESRGKIAKRQGSRAATIGYAQAAQTASQTAFSSYAWFATYA
jgi:hypothetical protein